MTTVPPATFSSRHRKRKGEGLGLGKGPVNGPQYHCNYCKKDISGQIRIRCAECPDFDLCLDCFRVGVEVHSGPVPHLKTHRYRVVDNLSFPLYHPTWGADEELLLLEAIDAYGLGNWQAVSEAVGGNKGEAACRAHYYAVYIDHNKFPEPLVMPDMQGINPAEYVHSPSKFDELRMRFAARKGSRMLGAAETLAAKSDAPLPSTGKRKSHKSGGRKSGHKRGKKDNAVVSKAQAAAPMPEQGSAMHNWNAAAAPSGTVMSTMAPSSAPSVSVRGGGNSEVTGGMAAGDADGMVESKWTEQQGGPVPDEALQAEQQQTGDVAMERTGANHVSAAGEQGNGVAATQLQEPTYPDDPGGQVQSMAAVLGASGTLPQGAAGVVGPPSDKAQDAPEATGPPGPGAGAAGPGASKARVTRVASYGGDQVAPADKTRGAPAVNKHDGGREEAVQGPREGVPGAAGPSQSGKVPRAGTDAMQGPGVVKIGANLVEITTYNQKRNEFEHEYDNDAELLIADMEFRPEDTAEEIADKQRLLAIYNARLTERERRREFIKERGLLDTKALQALEKRQTALERDMFAKLRPLARYAPVQQLQQLSEGLARENGLRRRIQELKDLRQHGVRTFQQAEEYEVWKRKRAAADVRTRASDIVNALETQRPGSPGRQAEVLKSIVSSTFGSQAGLENAVKTLTEETQLLDGFRSAAPALTAWRNKRGIALDITCTPGTELLTAKERELCATLRILPSHYLLLKSHLVRESQEAPLTRQEARTFFRLDPAKSLRIFDLLVSTGCIPSAEDATTTVYNCSVDAAPRSMHTSFARANGQQAAEDVQAPAAPGGLLAGPAHRTQQQTGHVHKATGTVAIAMLDEKAIPMHDKPAGNAAAPSQATQEVHAAAAPDVGQALSTIADVISQQPNGAGVTELYNSGHTAPTGYGGTAAQARPASNRPATPVNSPTGKGGPSLAAGAPVSVPDSPPTSQAVPVKSLSTAAIPSASAAPATAAVLASMTGAATPLKGSQGTPPKGMPLVPRGITASAAYLMSNSRPYQPAHPFAGARLPGLLQGLAAQAGAGPLSPGPHMPSASRGMVQSAASPAGVSHPFSGATNGVAAKADGAQPGSQSRGQQGLSRIQSPAKVAAQVAANAKAVAINQPHATGQAAATDNEAMVAVTGEKDEYSAKLMEAQTDVMHDALDRLPGMQDYMSESEFGDEIHDLDTDEDRAPSPKAEASWQQQQTQPVAQPQQATAHAATSLAAVQQQVVAQPAMQQQAMLQQAMQQQPSSQQALTQQAIMQQVMQQQAMQQQVMQQQIMQQQAMQQQQRLGQLGFVGSDAVSHGWQTGPGAPVEGGLAQQRAKPGWPEASRQGTHDLQPALAQALPAPQPILDGSWPYINNFTATGMPIGSAGAPAARQHLHHSEQQRMQLGHVLGSDSLQRQAATEQLQTAQRMVDPASFWHVHMQDPVQQQPMAGANLSGFGMVGSQVGSHPGPSGYSLGPWADMQQQQHMQRLAMPVQGLQPQVPLQTWLGGGSSSGVMQLGARTAPLQQMPVTQQAFQSRQMQGFPLILSQQTPQRTSSGALQGLLATEAALSPGSATAVHGAGLTASGIHAPASQAGRVPKGLAWGSDGQEVLEPGSGSVQDSVQWQAVAGANRTALGAMQTAGRAAGLTSPTRQILNAPSLAAVLTKLPVRQTAPSPGSGGVGALPPRS